MTTPVITNETEARNRVNELVEQAYAALREAELVADEWDVEFEFEGGGRGMGGWYSSGEWNASSQSC